MNTINCPVCSQPHEVGEFCPRCGFESRLYSDVPTEAIRMYEQQRIAAGRRVWDELIALREETNAGKTPVGFLITGKLVVYCLYEGINSFGLGSSASMGNEYSQRLLIPGVRLLPDHFKIEVQKSEDGRKNVFSISSSANEGSGVFLNTLTRKIEASPEQLNSGDILLLSSDGQKVDAELRFRKNISQ